MKVRKPSLLCLPMSLAYIIPMLTVLLLVLNRQAGSPVSWFTFMECITPSLIVGLALTIYFIHKARAA